MQAAFVIYRSQNDATARGKGVNRVHGYDVDPAVGRWGGIVLDEVVTESPNYKDPNDPTKVHKRKVIRETYTWEPVDCPHCGIVLDPSRPARCQECHKPVAYKSRHWYVCVPAEYDAARLANVKTEWTWQQINTEHELRFLKGEPIEDAAEEFVDPMDRHREYVNEVRSNVPSDYRDMQAKVDELVRVGAPKKELAHGKLTKKADMAAWIRKYEHMLGGTDAAE